MSDEPRVDVVKEVKKGKKNKVSAEEVIDNNLAGIVDAGEEIVIPE